MRALLTILAASLLPASVAMAQTATLTAERREFYAGMPFVLSINADGFDPSPPPTAGSLAIPGCTVKYLGVSTNTASSIVIINGVRQGSTRNTYVFRYSVMVPKPGTYDVPPVEVRQGQGKSARVAVTRGASFTVRDIATGKEMQLRMNLPERPIWVGETIPVTIDLYLRSDPQNPSFSVPLFERADWFDIRAPEGVTGRKTLDFVVGAQELPLPYEAEKASLDGNEYSRFRFSALATPKKPGTLALEPARVVAGLPSGKATRDMFGFPVERYEIMKAEDRPRTLEIRPLPLTDRPTFFSGAVGSSFSLSVQASRTVVRVGDPIELDILVRGNSELAGLRLPPLTGKATLADNLFDVPADLPPGQLVDQGRGKRFRVTVRLISTQAREIPAISFAYFDPTDGAYKTVRSEPIALSVAGSAVVGATEVVSAQPNAGKASAEAGAAATSLVGADFSLSSADDTLRTVASVKRWLPLLLALYIVPVLLFVAGLVRVRTRQERGEKSLKRSKLRTLEELLKQAEAEPAREIGPRIAAAIADLGRVTGQATGGAAVTRLENESFDPRAGDRPLRPELVKELAAMVQSWRGLVVLVLLLCATGTAHAAGGDEIERARAEYARALQKNERGERQRGFAAAAERFRGAVAATPDRPELVTDWGNAALGAGDFGTAILAYRRALALEPGLDRAQRNLSWVRQRLPAWATRASESSAASSLFFWHQALSPATRHLGAALAFTLAMLLLLPGWARAVRARRALASIALLVWLALFSSALLSGGGAAEGVVMTESNVLRSADSVGAPPVMTEPVPAGAEVDVLEARQSWNRVRLPSGSEGWLQSSAVTLID